MNQSKNNDLFNCYIIRILKIQPLLKRLSFFTFFSGSLELIDKDAYDDINEIGLGLGGW